MNELPLTPKSRSLELSERIIGIYRLFGPLSRTNSDPGGTLNVSGTIISDNIDSIEQYFYLIANTLPRQNLHV